MWVGLNIHRSGIRGQVGIGTLVIFIGMVSVAAIAAGVLINTAGLLEAQAQQTAAEATAEVSDIIEMTTVVGEASSTSPVNITKVNANLRLSAGSDPINVSKVSFTFSNSNNVTFISGNDTAEGENIEYIKRLGVKDNSTTLSDQSDSIVIQFNLTNIDGIQPVEPGSEVRIIVESPAGGKSYKHARVPDYIKEDESYIL